MIHVYVLRSLVDGKFYVGMTNDITRRIQEHNTGKVRSTKSRKPFKLIHKESFSDRKAARSREKYYKRGFGREQLKTTFL